MIEFRCEVIDAQGRKLQFCRKAVSQIACVKELLSQNMTPVRLRTGRRTLAEFMNRPVRLGANNGSADQALFLRQLAILINADMPVDRSLDLLSEQSGSARSKQMIAEMLNDVRSGQGLAYAFEARQDFPVWVTGIIRSSETGGNLGAALTNTADRMAVMSATRRRLVSALTYPLAVLVTTIIALTLILTLVVPQFEPIFSGAEDRLPSLTKFVLLLAKNVGTWLFTAFITLVVIIASAVLFLRSESGIALREAKPSFFPGQKLRDQYLAAQFSGLLATLVLNGVNAVLALGLISEAIGSARWRRQIKHALVQVREGEKLSAALSHARAFPVTARRLIETGETTGKLGEACREASLIMGDSAAQRIENIVTLVNPVAIILLGGVVALLVAGVMLGIFALGDFAG